MIDPQLEFMGKPNDQALGKDRCGEGFDETVRRYTRILPRSKGVQEARPRPAGGLLVPLKRKKIRAVDICGGDLDAASVGGTLRL